MRRPTIIAAALALTLAVPTMARAEPDAPDGNITDSVLSIDTNAAVLGIDLSKSVIPLEEEETNGAQITVRLSADVLFDFNKATLTATARRRIADLAPRLRTARGTVLVSGHSDSLGDATYNQTLSEQRAEAVKTELENALKGVTLRFQATGYGEARPVAPNELDGKDNPSGRAKNRRVEITYEKA
ncbi:hypothetical protein GCM10022254_04420 [Actinomadura meridiana]|uniref:OmpA-like domain-containing protein n=1 Tax=Actinomadura meridiana TaxID=559626 RepID=A0ABP8BSD9_9ACTN